MGNNFENQEGRLNYLNKKLDDLISVVNTSYGQTLLDELVTRLQRTITDFNEEVEGVMNELKKSSERRFQLLQDLKSDSTEDSINASSDENDSSANDSEMSEWEKRLEGK
jgi:DNA anti-recombination protein RmuC